MKIAIANIPYHPYHYGGAERSVALLSEALVRANHDVTVITVHPEPATMIDNLHGVTIVRLPLQNIYWPYSQKPHLPLRALWHLKDRWNFTAAEGFGRVLDDVQPDVVHTNVIAGLSAAIWEQVKFRNIRLVHTLRDYYLLCGRSSLMRDGDICEGRCLDCKVLCSKRVEASSLIDAVGSNSAYLLHRHEREGCFKNATKAVIFNIAGGAANMDLGNGAKDRACDLVFGFIGRIEPPKGIEILLRATNLLNIEGWRLRIAGSGTEAYTARLRAAYPDTRIEWLGFTNASQFYSSIDITIVPSIWAEPLPRTLIESFAAGKPAICADSGGIPEVANLGSVVEVYPATEVARLAALMDKALANPSDWLRGGWKDIASASLFSEESIVERYLELYRGAGNTDR